MEYAVKSTTVLVGLVVGYIVYCKIAKKEIRWYYLEGVVIGHILAQLLIIWIESMI